jgi:hypothetical protein
MRVVVNRANKPEIKPVDVCDYNKNILWVDLKDQMLQPYLLERKKGTKWCMKLFKWLFNIAIHNSMVIYRSHPNKEKTDTLQFRLSLAQGLMEKRSSGVHHPVHGHRSVQPRLNDSRKGISWSVFAPWGRRQDLTEDVWCVQKRARGKNLSMKDASRCSIHSSTSKPPASTAEIQGAHIIR